MPEIKQEEVIDSTTNEAEGGAEGETITISKSDWEKTNQTLGSLKRELKDFKKTPKEDSKETAQTKSDDNQLLEKAYLAARGITEDDEIDLALSTAKKWGVSVDKLVGDEDFNLKLEKARTQKSNELATSKIKGGSGKSQAKDTPEYWIAKGVPPSTTDVPDRKVRAKIARAMMANAKTSKTFYNE